LQPSPAGRGWSAGGGPGEGARIDPVALERFKREARAASALNHPNICVIHDIDEYEGQPFIAMELLEGQTLKQRISVGARHPDFAGTGGVPLQPAEGRTSDEDDLSRPVGIAATAPTASLDEAHLTSPGAVMGTVAYMSPEQARVEELDARTDLFSFGVLLYEMATGRQAFSEPTSAAIFDLPAVLPRWRRHDPRAGEAPLPAFPP
jgi:serine/threonine protein kinase